MAFTRLLRALCLVATCLLLTATGAWAQCADKSFRSTCICLNDTSCLGGPISIPLTQSCACEAGREVGMDAVAGLAVDALYIAGEGVETLEPLRGSLTAVRQGLAIVGTSVTTTEPLGSLVTLGSLTLRGNARLGDVDGLVNVTAVEGNVEVVENNGELDVGGLGGLETVGGDLALAGCALGASEGLQRLESVGGDLVVRGCAVSGTVLRGLEVVGGRLEVDSNRGGAPTGEFDLFGSLHGVCGGPRPGRGCGIVIRNNTGYAALDGYGNLAGFNGSLSILGNNGTREVKGFGELGFLEPAGHSDGSLEDRLRRVLGFTVAFNPDLVSLEGFDSLKRVGGDFIVADNPLLKRIIMTKLRIVRGQTRIEFNSGQLATYRSTEPLPFQEDTFLCIFTHTNVPTWRPLSESDPAFMTDLASYKCQINPVPMVLGTAVAGFTMAASVLVALYAASRHRSNPAASKTKLADSLAVHVVAIGDVMSDIFFATSCFIIWHLDGDPGVLMMGLLVAFVLVASQVYLMASTYCALFKRRRHMERGPGGSRLGKRDWCLLFPGLFILDTSVVELLPWEHKPLQGAEGEPREVPSARLARISQVAAFVGNIPQILLQTVFLTFAGGDYGWAIPAVVSLVLTAANFSIKGVFPILMNCFATAADAGDAVQEL